MISKENNDRLTQTGPGTPCGELMRRYWLPVALSEELPKGGAPLPVDILSEELMLFWDDKDRLGLIDRHCCHRATDLTYGRLEDGGVRGLYHGWLFDVNGKCLDQPGEPEGSNFYQKVFQQAYPTHVQNGVIFAYMGPGEPPVFPEYEFLRAPVEKCFTNKVFNDCNFLQSNEGNIDPVHTSYLHRPFHGAPGYIDIRGADRSVGELLRDEPRPNLEIEEQDYGVRIMTTRNAGKGKKFLRVTNFVMPSFACVGSVKNSDGFIALWHVPRDDETNWRYEWIFYRDREMDMAALAKDRLAETTAERRFMRTIKNRYLQDREAMITENYSGMGPRFPLQDAMAIETMGPIQDRTKEYLGVSDMAIIAARKMMLEGMEAIEQGEDPPNIVRDPAKRTYPNLVVFNEAIDEDVDVKTHCRELTEKASAKVPAE